MMPQDETPSLYDRLGGVYNIAVVVDDLIDRVMVDARLNANPRVDEAHHRVSAAGFKYYVTEMLCGAAGGPQVYTGRSMGDSHRHLVITEDEWAAFMDDLQQTLTASRCPTGSSRRSPRSSRAPRKRSSALRSKHSHDAMLLGAPSAVATQLTNPPSYTSFELDPSPRDLMARPLA